MEAREILEREYGTARNFMTPTVLGRGLIWRPGKGVRKVQGAYELSTGSGIVSGTIIFGVSVVEVHEDGSTSRRFDLSSCFHDKRVARAFIRKLKRNGMPTNEEMKDA